MRKKKEGLDIPFTDQKNKLERAKKGRHTYQYIFFLVLFECAALPLITLFVLIFKSFFFFFHSQMWLMMSSFTTRWTHKKVVKFLVQVLIFDWHENVRLCNDQCFADQQVGRLSICGKNLTLQFLRTMNIMNIKLCMVVILIELYPFVPLLVTLIVFQGHSSVKQF